MKNIYKKCRVCDKNFAHQEQEFGDMAIGGMYRLPKDDDTLCPGCLEAAKKSADSPDNAEQKDKRAKYFGVD